MKLRLKAMQAKRPATWLLHSACETYRCIKAVVLTELRPRNLQGSCVHGVHITIFKNKKGKLRKKPITQ